MKNELDVVRDISEKLKGLDIPFMLTGSMAMNYLLVQHSQAIHARYTSGVEKD
ncbi:MAG: hypothetical protein BMS9Abin37_2536 [Acidobacteriota bacterium]|nr:MAG: hypothetical protein BMS9Abin37_2536 [Acidobacteriota bacterium]